MKTTVEINESSYQKPNYSSNSGYNKYNNYNKYNKSGKSFKNSNSTPKSQCKFCFGPREILNIQKLLEANANNPDHVNQMRMPKSTTDFIKNWTGNAAHLDKVDLEALAETLDYLIEHVTEEIP